MSAIETDQAAATLAGSGKSGDQEWQNAGMWRALPFLFLLLAACTYVSDPSQNESQIARPGNFRAGSGMIDSIAVVPNQGPNKEKEPHLYRLQIRMDVGGFQTVDVVDNTFFAGEAVNLTNDGRVERVSGTTLPELFGKKK